MIDLPLPHKECWWWGAHARTKRPELLSEWRDLTSLRLQVNLEELQTRANFKSADVTQLCKSCCRTIVGGGWVKLELLVTVQDYSFHCFVLFAASNVQQPGVSDSAVRYPLLKAGLSKDRWSFPTKSPQQCDRHFQTHGDVEGEESLLPTYVPVAIARSSAALTRPYPQYGCTSFPPASWSHAKG